MAQNSIFLQIGPISESLNNACYSQNFLKLWYDPKCYETFQISSSPKFQAILVDFKVFKTLSIKS